MLFKIAPSGTGRVHAGEEAKRGVQRKKQEGGVQVLEATALPGGRGAKKIKVEFIDDEWLKQSHLTPHEQAQALSVAGFAVCPCRSTGQQQPAKGKGVRLS